MLASNATRLQRYRDALADLADSRKTPLAVREADEADPQVREQAERMQRAIDWHLRRTATAGHAGVAQRVEVEAAVERVARARQGPCRQVGQARARDRAGCRLLRRSGRPRRTARQRLEVVQCARVRATAAGDGGLEIEVADDGPGIPAERRRAVLGRGVRVDERVPGEGIGLHLVRSMVEEGYAGTIQIEPSELGGLGVRVRLPGERTANGRGEC